MQTSFSSGSRPQAQRTVLKYLLPVAGVLFVLLVASLLLMRPRPNPAPLAQNAELRVLAAAVETQAPEESTWRTGEDGAVLAMGTRVRTGPTGRAEVRFTDGSVLRMNTDTEIALAALPAGRDRDISVRLHAGEVWNRLLNLGAGGSYELDAEQALALVRGTAFSARRDDASFLVSAVQHQVSVRRADGAGLAVAESRRVAVNLLNPEASLPSDEPQDIAFLESRWRRTNLEADVLYLQHIAEARPELAAEALEALAHARCLLDVADCEDAPTVSELRTSVGEGTVTAFLELSNWDGRPLRVVWTREGTVVREATLRPLRGDLLAEDRLAVTQTGTYEVEAFLDRVSLRSAAFVVEEANLARPEPSSVPTSAPPGVCRTYESTSVCGSRQYYVDRDGDCVYEACVTCPTGRVGVDTNNDGYADTCDVPPTTSEPIASSPPPSSPVCADPGTCQYGWDQAACSCNPPPIAAYCGDGICNGNETCTSCSRDCGICPAPPPEPVQTEPVCGDGKVEGNETCDPPDGRTCSESCQRIVLQEPSPTPNDQLTEETVAL